MGHSPIDAVLAGTKGFAVALLAPLTAKVGTRPRVAGDPGQVLALCSGPSALAVIEFTGEGSLSAVQALVRDGRGVRVVAGLPLAHAGAEGTLRALGVEVGRWDGKVDGVIAAVERTIAIMSGGPPAVDTRPALAAATPAAAATRAPVGVRPPGPTPPGAAAAARPQATIPTVPAAPGAGGSSSAVRPQRATAPVAPRPVGVPPAGARAPAAQPAGSMPVAAARAIPAPARVAPAPVGPPPRMVSPPPAQVGAPIARPAIPTPAAAPPHPAAVPVQAASAQPLASPARPRPAAQFFEDLDGDVSVDVGDLSAEPPAAPPIDFHAPGKYVPPPPEPAADWPGGICSAAEAEDALQRALGGAAGPSRPLHELATRTLETLSDLERAVLSGEPQPIEVGPIRKAAVMRLRVADGLASAPPPGSAFDATALSAILGEIDALLAKVAPLLSDAPEELVPALEGIRNALVREAIDFSEAAQRVSGPTASAVPVVPAPRRAAATRIIESHLGADVPRSRHLGAWILLVIVSLLVGGYHLRRYLSRPVPQSPPTLPGAPDALRLLEQGGRQTLVTIPGKKVDPDQLERFRAAQALKGIEVREIAPGLYAVVPGRAEGGAP